ncbi:phosphonate ABC transporter substrate-binding protein [Kinneretia asaccharophila]|uniref:Phosphonate transport system substrate-binding protein n=1 Tax=Roseateles asaccharophilus TaxID=582607 RepID=A0A4V3CKA2_9BURK|nr:phosphonate ABC transporter substrate-binding protein [Roseateles asaccharophilus]MDN3543324.1 phosphonate ABC transporter substrate-binding protein [Roseateles asaccharophilus]TDP12977.1 phosphonate transport system substrate-binding protein [Roseateles asaccharophilus]
MFQLQRRALAVLALAAVAALPQARAQAPKEISFGIISTESSANLKSAWQPLLEDMQKVTGLKVNAFFAPDYAGVIEGMRFNKVQVGWFGNKSAIEAVDRAQGEVFARMVQPDGGIGYWGFIIARKDSPLNSLDDVIKQRQNLTLGFGDPNSTSGALVPGYYAFSQNKVDPTKDFKRMVRANHETNILAVHGKQIDIATVASDAMERMKLKQPEKHDELKVIWRSPLIASDPMVWRADLDAGTKKKVADFFLAYGKQPREKEILAKLTIGGFMKSDNSQLNPIRQLGLVAERAKIEGDANLSAEDKARRLQAIDQRLAELGQQTAAAK